MSILFHIVSPPQLTSTGIPPDGYHPGQLFFPLREISILSLSLSLFIILHWPYMPKKPRRFHVVAKKKEKKLRNWRFRREHVPREKAILQ